MKKWEFQERESIKKYKTQIIELSNCTKKFNKGDQQQNKSSKRKDQQTQRHGRLLPKKKEKRMKKSDDILRDLRNPIKQVNICMICVPEGEKRDKESESLFKEIMAENFLSLGKETDIKIQKTQKVPNKIKLKRHSSRHTVIKFSKTKDKYS